MLVILTIIIPRLTYLENVNTLNFLTFYRIIYTLHDELLILLYKYHQRVIFLYQLNPHLL